MINDKTYKLVLFNDNVHDYAYVASSLIHICNHTPIQAEQCVVITHNVGKCTIKEGDILDMIEMKTGLEKCELITEIENHESYMH
jgi:ATP-dependent Clp protease adaptor protein ClpS